MNFFFGACFLGFFISCATAFAQEPALPRPETQASPSPAASATPVPDLIPPDILSSTERSASPAPAAPNIPSLPQLDEAFKNNPVSAAAGQLQANAQMRQLKNQVVNGEKVKAARRAAEAARTDLQKRTLLRQYYEILYGEMIALAPHPEIKAFLAAKKKEQLNALPQPRVRPTPAAPR